MAEGRGGDLGGHNTCWDDLDGMGGRMGLGNLPEKESQLITWQTQECPYKIFNWSSPSSHFGQPTISIRAILCINWD